MAPARSRAPELGRLADAALGLTAFGWVVRTAVAWRALTPVTAALGCLNLVVGVLFLLRRPSKRNAGPAASLLCLISLGSSGLVLAAAPAPEMWPRLAQAVLLAGAALAIGSLGVLGRSFGLLPAVRGLVQGGPYRLVRHPAYLGELVMVLGAALAARSLAGTGAALLALGLVLVRIGIEERLLADSGGYRHYRARVRFRLLPFVW